MPSKNHSLGFSILYGLWLRCVWREARATMMSSSLRCVKGAVVVMALRSLRCGAFKSVGTRGGPYPFLS
eukprot:1913460-Pleurochrysis_carterae.AAC.1